LLQGNKDFSHIVRYNAIPELKGTERKQGKSLHIF